MAEVPPSGGFASRLRSHLVDPSCLIALVVGVVFWAAHGVGLVADVPLPVILSVLAVAWFVSCVAAAAWPGVLSGWRLWVRVGAGLGVTALVIYAIGWGPTLAIGLLFGAAGSIRMSGSSAVRPAMVWSAVWLALGELAIALGIAPTLVDEPLVHGLGFLATLGVIFTLQLFGRAARETERAQAELAESEQRFRALVQHASDIIMVIDPSNEVTYASPAMETVLGYPVEEILGTSGRDFLHPDDAVKLRELMSASSRTGVTRAEVRLRHRDGSWRWFEVSVTNLFDDPSVRGWVSNLRDVTERKESEAALLEAQEAFRHAFEDAPVGMALVGMDGRIFRANRSFAELLGQSQAELVGILTAELTHPDDREGSKRRRDGTYNADRGTYRFERRLLRADGGHVWVEATVSEVHDSEGTPIYYIGQVEDITERRALGERLAHEAAHDPMTGLPNRARFMARSAEVLHASRQRNRQLGVLFVDLDHFKMVNDALGHAAGDELLVTIAERLRGALRPDDVVARFGGDEFVVLCGNLTGTSMALNVAHRLTKSIAEPITLPSGEVFVTASVGIALSSNDGDTPESLLRHADSAMYLAKDQGRSRIEVFDPEKGESAVTLLKTGTELHRALERDELMLAYQPIVDLASGRVLGFEALLRWNHPDRGLVLPGEFIRLAEQVGLIVPIGAWVLETACRQTAKWQALRGGSRMPPITINVNLSPRQLADRGLVTSVGRIIRRTGIDARAVCLEITESSLMYDAERTISVLQALRDLGVHLSIDDFGTGFSSLSYLKRFPVEALKIDRTFVDGLGRESEDTSIVKAIVELSHALGITAVAEGLETPAQLEALRAIGCDFAQGFLLGRPLPAEAIGDRPADDLTAWQSTTA